jgi:hypothetical protein
MFHPNAVGGEAVAGSLITRGFAMRLQSVIGAVEAHGKGM